MYVFPPISPKYRAIKMEKKLAFFMASFLILFKKQKRNKNKNKKNNKITVFIQMSTQPYQI